MDSGMCRQIASTNPHTTIMVTEKPHHTARVRGGAEHRETRERRSIPMPTLAYKRGPRHPTHPPPIPTPPPHHIPTTLLTHTNHAPTTPPPRPTKVENDADVAVQAWWTGCLRSCRPRSGHRTARGRDRRKARHSLCWHTPSGSRSGTSGGWTQRRPEGVNWAHSIGFQARVRHTIELQLHHQSASNKDGR